FLYYLSNDYSLAEELVQETFFQAFKSIHRFRGDATFQTWLFQIGKNVYYKHLKKNPVHNSEFVESHMDADYLSPETILVIEEREKALQQALQQLNEPYKQVVVLRSFNELSFKEIGEVLEESENWARVTFYRGKLKLRELLKEVGKFDY